MRGALNFVYVINIIMQALFTLAFSIGAFFGLAYLSVNVLGGPTWLYVVFIIIGTLTGFVSMIRFVITAMQGYERLEKERDSKTKK